MPLDPPLKQVALSEAAEAFSARPHSVTLARHGSVNNGDKAFDGGQIHFTLPGA